MAQGAFSATIRQWAKETKERRDAIYQESTRRVIAAAQEPGPSKAVVSKAVSVGAGLGALKANGSRGASKRQFGPVSNPSGSGNMPVASGFLRASLVVLKGTNLPALKPNPPEGKAFSYDAGEVDLVIAGCKITDPITVAYTAAYARKIEYSGYRFVGLAAQQWSQIVDQVAQEAEARSKT